MPGMKPYSLAHTNTHPLARMLPLQREQMQVYRLGEKSPPADEFRNHAPTWEVVNVILNSLGSTRVRVNVQRDFTLLAVIASSTVNTARGGFRTQLYDMKKQLRFADRGQLFANFAGTMGGGTAGAALFLREPWRFDEADSQVLVIVQNMETAQNSIQVVMYGQALRFNDPVPGYEEFPGGVVSGLGVGR
jgi:hypothetical protein